MLNPIILSCRAMLALTSLVSVSALAGIQDDFRIDDLAQSNQVREATGIASYKLEMNQAHTAWKDAVRFACQKPGVETRLILADTATGWALESNHYESGMFVKDSSGRMRLSHLGLGWSIRKEKQKIIAFAKTWSTRPRNFFDTYVRLYELSLLPKKYGGLEFSVSKAQDFAAKQVERLHKMFSAERITVSDADTYFLQTLKQMVSDQEKEDRRLWRMEKIAQDINKPYGHFR